MHFQLYETSNPLIYMIIITYVCKFRALSWKWGGKRKCQKYNLLLLCTMNNAPISTSGSYSSLSQRNRMQMIAITRILLYEDTYFNRRHDNFQLLSRMLFMRCCLTLTLSIHMKLFSEFETLKICFFYGFYSSGSYAKCLKFSNQKLSSLRSSFYLSFHYYLLFFHHFGSNLTTEKLVEWFCFKSKLAYYSKSILTISIPSAMEEISIDW